MLARRSTRNSGLIQQVDQQLAVTGYTIQVGAFTSRANADKAAKTYAVKAASARVGVVKVTVALRAGGRSVNLVQVGRFATFNAASEARSRLGDSGAVVVPLQH